MRVKDISQPVKLSYKANISQNTGEDWTNVKLRVSSGNPDEGMEKPDVKPWHLRFFSELVYISEDPLNITKVTGVIRDENGPLPYAVVAVKGTTVGTTTDMEGKYSLALPKGAKTLIVTYEKLKTQKMSINLRLKSLSHFHSRFLSRTLTHYFRGTRKYLAAYILPSLSFLP